MDFHIDNLPKNMRISNKEVSLPAFNAVWDTKNEQLVAIGLASSNIQSLKSILATLATNGNRQLTLRGDRETWGTWSVYLNNAKKGYFKQGRKLETVNARGYSLSLEHPTCINPKLDKFEFFYVLGRTGEDYKHKFVDRLNTVIRWPFHYAMVDYLLEVGERTKTIHPLKMTGPGYEWGVCVRKNDQAWESILKSGIRSKEISIYTKDQN